MANICFHINIKYLLVIEENDDSGSLDYRKPTFIRVRENFFARFARALSSHFSPQISSQMSLAFYFQDNLNRDREKNLVASKYFISCKT